MILILSFIIYYSLRPKFEVARLSNEFRVSMNGTFYDYRYSNQFDINIMPEVGDYVKGKLSITQDDFEGYKYIFVITEIAKEPYTVD